MSDVLCLMFKATRVRARGHVPNGSLGNLRTGVYSGLYDVSRSAIAPAEPRVYEAVIQHLIPSTPQDNFNT